MKKLKNLNSNELWVVFIAAIFIASLIIRWWNPEIPKWITRNNYIENMNNSYLKYLFIVLWIIVRICGTLTLSAIGWLFVVCMTWVVIETINGLYSMLTRIIPLKNKKLFKKEHFPSTIFVL